MDNIVAQHPSLVSKVNIGHSFEKRPMNVLKVHRCSCGFSSQEASRIPLLQAGLPSSLCLRSGSSPHPPTFLLLTGPCWF